jgi:hypothetical protein
MINLFQESTKEESKQKILKDLQNRKKKKWPVGEDGIIFRYQEDSYDCGQTCLEMLGYEGHQMFPEKRGLREEELEKIDGVKTYEGDNFFFKIPCMISTTNVFDEQRHWVIGHKDKIYCPTLGILPNKKYRKSVWFDNLYEIPLIN